MKSLLQRGLAGAVLLSSSVLVCAQPAFTPLHEYSSRASSYGSGGYASNGYASDGYESGHDYRQGYGYGEVVMPDRTSVVELPGRGLPDAELNRRLKDDAPPVAPAPEPRAKPKSENAARDEFYRQLHRHADGRGTLEEVEDAYRDLLPFRR